MTTTIIIRKTATGFDIVGHKTHGLGKGDTLLASTAGGLLGREMAITAARLAMTFWMADELAFEGPDGSAKFGQMMLDAVTHGSTSKAEMVAAAAAGEFPIAAN